jgi:hypothetical protein
MTTNFSATPTVSAKIYTFPPRGRFALRIDDTAPRTRARTDARRRRPGRQSKRSLTPSSAMPLSAVLQISPGCTGMARVSVPVVTISPAASA